MANKYEQLRLFDTTVYDALVQPRADAWETFVTATKGATFDSMPPNKETTTRGKPGRKTRKK